MSSSPCCRSHPAGGHPSRQPDCDETRGLRSANNCSASGCLRLSGLPLRSLSLRPGDSLTILVMALSMGFRASVSLRPAIQATGRLALAPAGLPPAEHICLVWTHAGGCSRTRTASASAWSAATDATTRAGSPTWRRRSPPRASHGSAASAPSTALQRLPAWPRGRSEVARGCEPRGRRLADLPDEAETTYRMTAACT
jgi:hypothetical protein